MRICIDAGHGGFDSGAYNKDLNLRECDITLRVALKTGEKLGKMGHKIIFTRTSDDGLGNNTSISLRNRVSIANKNNADIFISIHCNSADNPQARGIETYYYQGSANGKKLAELVQAELIKATGFINRGVKTANYYVIKYTKMPAVLVEIGFISNNDEAKQLAGPNVQDKIAQAIAEAVNKYMRGV